MKKDAKETKRRDVPVRTVIATIITVLAFAIGVAPLSATASSDWPRQSAGTERPHQTLQDDPAATLNAAQSVDPVFSDASAIDLFNVRSDLDPLVRNILNSPLLDVPDFGQAVPDPNVLAIFGLGLLLLGFARRFAP